MKTLFLVRHAKASRDDSFQSDVKRSLKSEGVVRAKAVAKIVKNKKYQPQHFVSSHAVRAFQTAQVFASEYHFPEKQIEISHQIYEESTGSLMDLIHSFSDDYDAIIVFGHNPGFTDLCNYLCDNEEVYLSTSAIAVIELEILKWKNADRGIGKLVFMESGK